MYCKNCGRELKSGMRFCDRCGQSVRQGKKTESAARREELEAVKEERLNRRKKIAELEAKKAEKKNKRKANKKKNKTLIYFIAIILLAAVSAIITYIAVMINSNNAAWKTRDGAEALNSTAAPTVEPSDKASSTPVPTSLPVVGVETENTDPINADGYRVFTVSNTLSCPYPTAFSKKQSDGDTVLSLFDNVGGASMQIAYEKSSASAQPSELLKEYAQNTPGTVLYSLAGNNWFGVTTSKNDIITHRKYLILDGKSIYYSLQYDKNSVSAADYEKYIEYIDNAFTQ